jgi:hypothetical protein
MLLNSFHFLKDCKVKFIIEKHNEDELLVLLLENEISFHQSLVYALSRCV